MCTKAPVIDLLFLVIHVLAVNGDIGYRDGLVWIYSALYSGSISLSAACSEEWHALAGSGSMNAASRSVAIR